MSLTGLYLEGLIHGGAYFRNFYGLQGVAEATSQHLVFLAQRSHCTLNTRTNIYKSVAPWSRTILMHEKSKFDYCTHRQIKFVKETIAQKTCANEIVNETCPEKVFVIKENCRIGSRCIQNQKEKGKSKIIQIIKFSTSDNAFRVTLIGSLNLCYQLIYLSLTLYGE